MRRLRSSDVVPAVRRRASLRLYISPRNVNNRRLHVRGVVDGFEVVTRSWSSRKRGWRYAVDHISQLIGWAEAGWLFEVKP